MITDSKMPEVGSKHRIQDHKRKVWRPVEVTGVVASEKIECTIIQYKWLDGAGPRTAGSMRYSTWIQPNVVKPESVFEEKPTEGDVLTEILRVLQNLEKSRGLADNKIALLQTRIDTMTNVVADTSDRLEKISAGVEHVSRALGALPSSRAIDCLQNDVTRLARDVGDSRRMVQELHSSLFTPHK